MTAHENVSGVNEREEPAPTCQHENFAADVKVNRITRGEGGPVGAFMADITVRCVDCNLPFRWIGVAAGMSYDRPMVGIDNRELRAPLEPDTAEAIARLEGARGFSVNLVKGGEKVS